MLSDSPIPGMIEAADNHITKLRATIVTLEDEISRLEGYINILRGSSGEVVTPSPKTGARAYKKFDFGELQDKIFSYLLTGQEKTTTELAKDMKADRRQVAKVIAELEQRGVIEVVKIIDTPVGLRKYYKLSSAHIER